MITTIACPTDLEHPEVNVETAPIWVDAKGVPYRVASGILPEQVGLDPRIKIATGPDGLSALAEMGLVAREELNG